MIGQKDEAACLEPARYFHVAALTSVALGS